MLGTNNLLCWLITIDLRKLAAELAEQKQEAEVEKSTKSLVQATMQGVDDSRFAEVLETCLKCIASPEEPEKFQAQLAEAHPHQVKCEEVWTDDHIAYRCRYFHSV